MELYVRGNVLLVVLKAVRHSNCFGMSHIEKSDVCNKRIKCVLLYFVSCVAWSLIGGQKCERARTPS